MRTLLEIIEEVEDGGRPDYEELRYALLAYRAMFIMDHNNLLQELTSGKETPQFLKKMRADNSFNMLKNALIKSPKEWLGPNYDPDSQDYQSSRKLSRKILDKFMEDRNNMN
ncbi:hypothetical protein [Desulfosporosinus youngiae]|uniref:Uncharacterized protein n=1 Tax=Desulfosporosinus youngiae DSM 17734 TaxID=768710 RepID=H5XZW3_9FIRM|nr:hypothetical protein [Desulfosporosinus youngiae]EHQ92159.1 hypothetical protein DesyoDRAFT_5228 [Desulfosporosinus youngiae DSM 17734]